MDTKKLLKVYQSYFETIHDKKIKKVLVEEIPYLEIDFEGLIAFVPNLYDSFREHPAEHIKVIKSL